MGWLGWVILFIVVGTALKAYVFLPLRIRKETWISAAPEFISVDPSDPRVPASIRAFFRDVAGQLKPAGFSPVMWVLSPDAYKGVSAFLAIFENLGDNAAAAAVATSAETPTGARLTTYTVDIETSFVDRTALSTTNSSDASTYPVTPWKRAYKFALMADLELLYRIHRHLAAASTGTPKETPPEHEDVLSDLRDSIEREYTEHVRTGHLVLAEDGQHHYHTVRGAYRAVWSQLWPLKHILRATDRKAAGRVLRELGLSPEYETVDYKAKYKGVDEEAETVERVEE